MPPAPQPCSDRGAKCPDRPCRYVSADGSVEYRGEWMKGEYCGTGELKIDGSLLKGTFKDGWLVDGTHTLPGGTEFSGKPDEGSWSGDGLAVQYAGGATYSGELLAGLPHGAGHLKQPSGAAFRGDFSGGRKAGSGAPASRRARRRRRARAERRARARGAQARWSSPLAKRSRGASRGACGCRARARSASRAAGNCAGNSRMGGARRPQRRERGGS